MLNFPSSIPDPRHLSHGWEIPTLSYSDQPYVVVADDGAWVCCLTTGSGHEGEPGQHVITLRSTDEGRTWEAPVAVEPVDGPEASYAVLLKGPSGRLFIFYNHNTDNTREIRATPGPSFPDGICRRVDSQGSFVFKTSDDHGKNWSPHRIPIPQRLFEIDRENPYGGDLLFFWNVGKAFAHEGTAFVPLHKVGEMGNGFFVRSEGSLLASKNLFKVEDPATATWETLPEGEVGIRAPEGGNTVAEEHSFTVLSDGSFYVIYRTIAGYPATSVSRDRGRTWSEPQFLTYANGRRIKNPRAANFVWRCSNGHFLYWFHNHGGERLQDLPNVRSDAYNDRNPVWVCGGVEVDSPEGKSIQWSQPEVLLYDDDPFVRMSYPDLIEKGGSYFFTETQKDTARTHPVEAGLLQGLWNQLSAKPVVNREGLLLEAGGEGTVEPPELPDLVVRDVERADYGSKDLRGGFTLDLKVEASALEPGSVLLENRDSQGKGFCLRINDRRALEFTAFDRLSRMDHEGDPGLLPREGRVNLSLVVDGGPKILFFMVDGVLDDGGDRRQFGWGRYNPNFRSFEGGPRLVLHPGLENVRLYGRALRVAELVQNHRAEA